MRLSAQSDFSLRLLMLLATNPERLCTINEIAKTYLISKNHMMKVAHLLVKEGVIISVRGRKGGLKLAKPPENIVIGAILRITEDKLSILDCLQKDSKKHCVVDSACRLKGALAKATKAFIAVLDTYTLADIVNDNSELYQILQLQAVPSNIMLN